jgi:hypothetical protein
MGYNELSSGKRTLYYILGFFCIALSAYGYAAFWMVLPVYCLLLLIYYNIKKKITIRQISFSLTVIFILALPLILFAIQLVTKGEQYEIGPITITTLKESRFNAVEGSFYHSIKGGLKMLLSIHDFEPWHSFPFFGEFYNILGIPFILLAFILMIKQKGMNVIDIVFLFMLIASIPVIAFVEPNVNRWNCIWFPLLFFMAKGLYSCTKNVKLRQYSVITLLIILCFIFGYKYVTFFHKTGAYSWNTGFIAGYEKPLDFTQSKKFNQIFFEDTYVYPLFHYPVNPYEFDKNHYLAEENKDYAIECFSSYNNFIFKIPKIIVPTPNTAYILNSKDLIDKKIDYSKFHVEKGEIFTLLWTD